MTRGIMALAAKQNNYEKLIKDLFKRYAIPLNRPEYKELLEQGEKASLMGSFAAMDRHFESRVLSLAEAIKGEEFEEIRQEKAQERSLEIASERSLAPVRLNNSRLLMALPWFSPDQRLRKDYFEYTSPDGSIKLEVHPSPKCGAAKVWDGDVLMYALSKAVGAYLETKKFPKRVKFTAYEYLKQAGKNPEAGKNIKDIKDKLDRLSLTNYKCSAINTETGKESGGRTFKLCDYKWTNDGSGKIDQIEIVLSDEIFEYFATKNDLLTLKKGLLLEAWKEDRSGLRKRLLVLVGTRLGEQPLWKIGLSNLKNLCGYTNELKYFKREFLKLTPSLPWIIDIEKNKKGEQIATFTPKDE
jgi:hypothetical protein